MEGPARQAQVRHQRRRQGSGQGQGRAIPEGFPAGQLRFDEQARAAIELHFGKRVLVTDRHDWTDQKIRVPWSSTPPRAGPAALGSWRKRNRKPWPSLNPWCRQQRPFAIPRERPELIAESAIGPCSHPGFPKLPLEHDEILVRIVREQIEKFVKNVLFRR